MWIFFTCLGIGIAIGLINSLPKKFMKFNLWFQRAGIILLLFSMGASIGSNKKMLHEIKFIGIKSFTFAATACLLSVIITFIITKKLIGDGEKR